MAPRWLPLLCLGIILTGGGYLRLADLAREPMRNEELDHYYAAVSLARESVPRLPSGQRYDRGIDYTRLVGASLEAVKPVERAVRLPAAIFGVLSLCLFAAALASMAGAWPSVWGTLLLTIYPEAIRLSRFGRFYSWQLALGVVAFYCGYRALRDAGAKAPPSQRSRTVQWGWALATIAALLYAARLQVVTLSVGLAWGIAVLVAALADLRARGRSSWKDSAPLQVVVAGIIVAALFFAVGREEIALMTWQAEAKPFWARAADTGAGPLSYYYLLSLSFPILVSLAPLIFLVTIVQQGRLGWYLLAWFGIPLLVHSLLLAWKGERFILLAVPGLLAAAGIAAASGAGALSRVFLRWFAARGVSDRWSQRSGAALVALVSLTLVLTTPAFHQARKGITHLEPNPWLAVRALLADSSEDGALPWGSAEPLPALFYLGRLDFTVGQGQLETWTPNLEGGGDDPYEWAPMGSPDQYAGAPVLTTPAAIRARFPEAPSVLVAVDQRYFVYHNLDPALQDSLALTATDLCRGRCGSLRLFRLPLQAHAGNR